MNLNTNKPIKTARTFTLTLSTQEKLLELAQEQNVHQNQVFEDAVNHLYIKNKKKDLISE